VVSDPGMKIRWRLALPIIGLMLFALVTYNSFHKSGRSYHLADSRYFYWSTLRLDSDPLKAPPAVPQACVDPTRECIEWPPYLAPKPGIAASILAISALPAFLVVAGLVKESGKLGISQVSSFMVLMPLLLAGWYYFLGWLFDRRRHKHSHTALQNSHSGSNL
jgi:hypothetical protein